MLVSAISMNHTKGFCMSGSKTYNNRSNETIGDTSFNSLTPYTSNKKAASADNLKQVYANINEWQNFCHNQIIGSKFNVIA